MKPAISRLSRDPPAPAVLESLWNAVILQSRETTELPQFFTLRIWLFLLEFLPLAVSFPPTVCRFAEATLDAALALPAGLDKDGEGEETQEMQEETQEETQETQETLPPSQSID